MAQNNNNEEFLCIFYLLYKETYLLYVQTIVHLHMEGLLRLRLSSQICD